MPGPGAPSPSAGVWRSLLNPLVALEAEVPSRSPAGPKVATTSYVWPAASVVVIVVVYGAVGRRLVVVVERAEVVVVVGVVVSVGHV